MLTGCIRLPPYSNSKERVWGQARLLRGYQSHYQDELLLERTGRKSVIVEITDAIVLLFFIATFTCGLLTETASFA